MGAMPKPTSPSVVALVRGVLLAAAAAAIGAAITGLTTADLGDLAWIGPIAILVLRQLEGIVLDAGRGVPKQEGLLGGRDAVPPPPPAP